MNTKNEDFETVTHFENLLSDFAPVIESLKAEARTSYRRHGVWYFDEDAATEAAEGLAGIAIARMTGGAEGRYDREMIADYAA